MEFKTFIQLFFIFAYLYDIAVMLYFSSLLGIEHEINDIVRLLIQEKKWYSLFRYSLTYFFGILYFLNSLSTEKTNIKYLSLIVPILHILSGSTWIFAYFSIW